jgi:hypothetical protein
MDEIEYGATVAAQEEYEMEQKPAQSTFATLRTINVNEHVEKKGNLSYLSWAWAVDILLQRDPTATWDYRWIDDRPYCRIGETVMVFCTVKAFGVERTAQLPVMDHKNKPIANPDSFAVNTAMQRCLAKAIALHGIGLYIYAGEDVPQGDETKEVDPIPPELLNSARDAATNGVAAFRAFYAKLTEPQRILLESDMPSLKAAAIASNKVPA